MILSRAPLRLSSDRIWFFGVLCAVYASLPFIVVPHRLYDMATINDFANYWSAGATVGTPTLGDPTKLTAWQLAHHVSPQPFVYPPGFAWLYAPFAHLPPMTAMVVAQILMAGLFAFAAWLIKRIYRFPLWFSLIAVFAWGPTIGTLEDGQNTALALVLSLFAIVALVKDRPMLAGLAVGLMFYKPTDAAALVFLLAARRHWGALSIAGLCVLAWYLLSVAATGGNWSWPVIYADTIQAWYRVHSAGNPHLVFTLPTMLLATHVPIAVVLAVAAGVLILAIPALARRPILEAASMAPLVGLTANIHAWSYTAALMLPALCYAMLALSEPWRTRIIIVAYLAGAAGVSTLYGPHAVAVVCVVGTFAWLAFGYRQADDSAASVA